MPAVPVNWRGLARVLPLCAGLLLAGCHKAGKVVVCYNCATEWGAWGATFAAFRARTGITVPSDNRNTGQALAAGLAERAHPIADVLYMGGQGGMQARDLHLTQPFYPASAGRIPAGMKDPDGYWYAVHTGTIGFFVNTAALDGRPVPRAWRDLLDPRYRGMIGYFDPTSAAAGLVGALAVNRALGGSYDNLEPGMAFFRQLRANAPVVLRQTAYARVLSGDIPIMVDYDFNAYRAAYQDHAPVHFVIPEEGSASFPYVLSLVAHAPHGADARRFAEFVLSDEGQALWARAYLRPVLRSAMPAGIASRFLPESDYARAPLLDLRAVADCQARFSRLYDAGAGAR